MEVGQTARQRPGGRDGVVLAASAVLVLVVALLGAVHAQPPSGRTFSLVTGSVYVDDDRAPVAVDLARGRPPSGWSRRTGWWRPPPRRTSRSSRSRRARCCSTGAAGH
ncbi:MAG: hypothetical protein U0Q15_18305 [Kineosporiaceae bacterium]